MFENYKAVQMSDVTFSYKFLDYFALKYLTEFNFFHRKSKIALSTPHWKYVQLYYFIYTHLKHYF